MVQKIVWGLVQVMVWGLVWGMVQGKGLENDSGKG